MDSTSLRALLEKVEAATGPDRELDHLVHNELVQSVGSLLYDTKERGGALIAAEIVAPIYSASVDAAIRLVERLLPESYLDMDTANCAFLRVGDWDCGDAWNMPSLPLAIIAALLRALIAQQEA